MSLGHSAVPGSRAGRVTGTGQKAKEASLKGLTAEIWDNLTSK